MRLVPVLGSCDTCAGVTTLPTRSYTSGVLPSVSSAVSANDEVKKMCVPSADIPL